MGEEEEEEDEEEEEEEEEAHHVKCPWMCTVPWHYLSALQSFSQINMRKKKCSSEFATSSCVGNLQ